MTNSTSSKDSLFDSYACDYDEALEQGISVSGEDKSYFASGRMTWLAGCLERLGEKPRSVMDFGCGTGSAAPYVLEKLGAETLVGVDQSLESLRVATRNHASDRVVFLPIDQYEPQEALDLVFCAGVFHHIPPTERADALNYLYKSLKPGGIFAFWENNPWNPGTRYVMSRIPFDRDAVTVSMLEARRLVQAAKFQVLRTDFVFIFPHLLRWFRRMEPAVSRLPLGAQYQVLCRKK